MMSPAPSTMAASTALSAAARRMAVTSRITPSPTRAPLGAGHDVAWVSPMNEEPSLRVYSASTRTGPAGRRTRARLRVRAAR